ncbi:MAG: carbohydrate-binding family 9-like protein [Verrucomicrobiae bacterium]|nr:carbohydrate-binding family 9-like protein [Verrucomicrobiae bacterium]NNJ86402.1 carbohydrate-binding family 9-like protein [Akkermansiaceae bacterium]
MSRLPKKYQCPRVVGPLKLDGFISDPVWKDVPWTDDFVDITGDPERKPYFRTRAKMAWDDIYFYVAAEMEEADVWGTITKQNEIIFNDNDFEVFIDPDGDARNYYEFEMNALGTIWELSLPVPYSEGGVPVLGCNLPGLIRKVGVNGKLNDPTTRDKNWCVEMAFPWKELAQYNPGRSTPPEPGDMWKVNFSRVQWQHEVVDGNYVRIPPHGTNLSTGLNPEDQQHPEDNWVWSPQGVVNMHIPQHWGEVTFQA